ncbi:MAG: ATP-binding protein [Alphaproteobacteria bacterium]|nr:ATP-binding protein [Alphaproteobacteria bacterium]MDP6876498.1 ATP-binding protein [Alphaproteobacteria bacterium]
MTIAANVSDGDYLKPAARRDNHALLGRGPARQIRLLAVLLLISLALTVALLLWFAQSQDKIALANSRHLADTALKVQLQALPKINTDYTWWDEAYQKTVEAFDPEWFDENFADAEYFANTFGITGSFIVDPNNRMLRHMRASEIVPDAHLMETAGYFSGGINELLNGARQIVDDEFVATMGFVILDGQPYFATARAIHPHTEELLAKAAVTPANAFISVMLRPLDAALLQTVADDFGLPHLRLVETSDAAGIWPLHTVNGQNIGALTWRADRPSIYIMNVILPGLLAVILCIGALGWFVLNGLRRGQAQILLAAQQAHMADRSKSEFLANMSHELRTPLNAIIGFSEMMRNETLGPIGNESYREYSGNILDSGQHLLDIINDVLDLSKVEAGKFTLEETEVDLGSMIASLCHIVEPRAREKRIELNISVPPDLPAVMADSRSLKQILVNLLSNAVKFTPDGGKIGVHVAHNSTGEVAFAVSDTGHGVPQDQLALVMQPFHRVAGTLTSSESGTGLGLPLSASLVQLHGGEMRFESEVNQGTTVSVTLPKDRVVTAQKT